MFAFAHSSRKISRPSVQFMLPLGLFAILTGCGGTEQKDGLTEAFGTVTLDGEPLADAQVFFDHPDHPETFGRTDAEGRYEMAYTRSQEGAFIGSNVVSFETIDIDRELGRGNGQPQERVPREYVPGKSKLTVEVTDGGAPYDFDLKSDGRAPSK
ncbi:MAG: hypothetical protein AB7U20_24680 [Planctomycetaceae bacterium]